MKKYKLLKELPTFKVGEIFILEDGSLFYYPADNGTDNAHWSDKIMAYHHKTLEKFPNILEEWFEEIKEPKGFWIIESDGSIQYITDDMLYTEYVNGNDFMACCKQIGNKFDTKKEAERAVEKFKAWKRLNEAGLEINAENVSDIESITDGYVDFDLHCYFKRYHGFGEDLDLLFKRGGEE